jgi:nucleoside-diphosphate-sugar epimerase
MKILLTGASGNFGQEFIRQTIHKVTPLNRSDWNFLDEKIKGINLIIHAACDLHSKVEEFPEKLLNSNILSTAKLLEAMKKNKVNHLIFISSCAVYGNSISNQEVSTCLPTSINGIGKLLNERVIEQFCTKNDITFQILRVFNTYGGNDSFSILSHIKRSLENKIPFNLNNNGIAQRDFIHISDVVSITCKIIDKNITSSYLNVGTGQATRISSIIVVVRNVFSEMLISHTQVEEAEYSRANISLLSSEINHEFISVEKYLNDTFIPSIKV